MIVPIASRFRPDFVLVSAGFDAHRDDPLAQMDLSEEGFAEMTRRIVHASNHHCAGRIVSALEGGYHLRALARSAVRHLQEMTIED